MDIFQILCAEWIHRIRICYTWKFRDYYREKLDRKSTRLNSSHDQISYAVFCLKKKKNKTKQNTLANRIYIDVNGYERVGCKHKVAQDSIAIEDACRVH